MNLTTTTTIKLLGVVLLLAIAALLIFTLAQAHQNPLVSIGWHDLASVGWVTSPA